MSPERFTDLEELARLCGVATSYAGDDGVRRASDVETTLSVLRALGVDVDTLEDAPRALHARRRELAEHVSEPVIAVRLGQRVELALNVPRGHLAEELTLTLEFEDGEVLQHALSNYPHDVEVAWDVYGERSSRVRTSLAPLPLGYHRLFVETRAPTSEARLSSTLLVCSPSCPRSTRGWGGFLPLYALRTKDDWGVGTYSGLGQLGRWLAERGASFVGGLPLYPLFLDEGDASPYRPVSRLAYNELYVDPRILPEFEPSLLSGADVAHWITRARSGVNVDYASVAALTRRVLEPMSRSLLAEGSNLRAKELESFLVERPEIAAYSAFRACAERKTEQSASTSAEDVMRDPLALYYAYGQWAAAEQLHQVAQQTPLYSDLPVGTHPNGFDPIWSPASFVPALSTGAPPDRFFARGQDWGFSPWHPDRIRADGYSHAREVLARAFRSTSYVRIDHIMGLQRLYVIPGGADATRGTYLHYRPDEFYALISLEAHRAGARVIGEDLGTTPRDLSKRMAKRRILRSWVFEFASTERTPLPDPPSDVLASLSTHDTPRFNAYLWGLDIDDSQQRGDLSEPEADESRAQRALYREALFRSLDIPVLDHHSLTRAARRGALAHLARSEATLVLVDLEELTGEVSPQNRPGTTEGNWERRSALTLEEMSASHEVHRDLDVVNRTRQRVS